MNAPISLTGVEFFSEDGKKSFYVCGCFKEKDLLKENEDLKKENNHLKRLSDAISRDCNETALDRNSWRDRAVRAETQLQDLALLHSLYGPAE